MKRAPLILTLILTCTLTINAQQHKYNRAGINILHTTYSDQLDKPNNQFFQTYTPDPRYDINTISTKTLPAHWPRTTFKTNSEGTKKYTTTEHTEEITTFLNQKNIGNQIIASIFNRKPDGTMDLIKVHHRGQYNATDADYKQVISTKRGAEALKETGELLINNSYIIVIDNQNSRYEYNTSSNEYYYLGNTIAYIFKITWTEEMLYQLWDCWIDENTPEEEKESRRETFDKLHIPLTFLGLEKGTEISINTYVEAAKKAPLAYGRKTEAQLKEEALMKLFRTGIDQSFENFEKDNEDLALKTSIYDTHPLRAKLGTKEGLRTDYTFYVYENVQDASGTIKAKRVGVIRSTNKIADNARVTTGDFEPSVFYQYAGKKLQPGQDITEKKKGNIALELGATYYSQNNKKIGFDIAAEMDFYSTMHTQGYFGFRGAIQGEGCNFGIYGGYGFRTNNFHIFPLVGIYADGLLLGTSQPENEKKPIATLAQLALKANLNIYYPFQLYAQAGYNFKISENQMYQYYKGDRNIYGFNASAGIRFCF